MWSIQLQLQHFVEILAPMLMQVLKDMGENYQHSVVSKDGIVNHYFGNVLFRLLSSLIGR